MHQRIAENASHQGGPSRSHMAEDRRTTGVQGDVQGPHFRGDAPLDLEGRRVGDGLKIAPGISSRIPNENPRNRILLVTGHPQGQHPMSKARHLSHPQGPSPGIQQGGLTAGPGMGQVPGRWRPQNHRILQRIGFFR